MDQYGGWEMVAKSGPLPTPQTYQVQRVIDSQCLVASLINPIFKSWNVDLIQEVFSGDEA